MLGLAGLTFGAIYADHAAGPGTLDFVLSWLGGNGAREAGALLVLVAILVTPPLRRFFETKPLRRLGELSFPIYLVHVPLIVGPVCYVFATFAPLSTRR